MKLLVLTETTAVDEEGRTYQPQRLAPSPEGEVATYWQPDGGSLAPVDLYALEDWPPPEDDYDDPETVLDCYTIVASLAIYGAGANFDALIAKARALTNYTPPAQDQAT